MNTKRCKGICKKEKPVDEFIRSNNPRNDGYWYCCKDCYRLLKVRRKIRKMNVQQKSDYLIELYYSQQESVDRCVSYFECDKQHLITYLKHIGFYDRSKKPCGRCGVIKDLEEYSERSRYTTGWCKECVREYNKQYYQDNMEELKKRANDYYYENYEYVREWQNAYCRRMIVESEDFRKKRKDYYKKIKRENPERFLEHQRTYIRNNPGKAAAFRKRYQLSKKNATPSWANFNEISWYYDEAKRLTNQTGIKHEVDHIIPIINPVVCGLHVEHNLQILTKTQNCQKHNKFEPGNIEDYDIV